MNERTEILLGSDNIKNLSGKNVIVFGVGGVGGYVCEMLVRAGIGQITIVDFDIVDKSNLNRQIIALNSTIGLPKVEVMKNRLMDINDHLEIEVFNEKFCEENSDILTSKYDYVIDAIDDIENKVLLIKKSHELGLNIISAMGAGNRFDIPNFKVADIYDTYNDGLSKILRKKLKDIGIEKHTVVFSNTLPIKAKPVGSISYYPSMCGCILSAYVINKLLDNNFKVN